MKTWDPFVSVSYTHLDVYKRQAYNIAVRIITYLNNQTGTL